MTTGIEAEMLPPASTELERQLEALHTSSYGWALACCGWDRDAAEDVLQSAYLKAIDGTAAFDGLSSVKTWFFGVVKRTAAESRRKHAVRGAALRRWIDGRPVATPMKTPDRSIEVADERHRLQQMLRQLSSRQRELLHLVFYQDLTIEDAAGVLEIGVGSARTHYERGKARLRELMQRSGVTR